MSDQLCGSDSAKPVLPRASHCIRPNAQAFDKIVMKTVPRWKESEMSGDEWRISTLIEFSRNGEVVHEMTWGDLNHAVKDLGHMFDKSIEAMPGGYSLAGDGVHCDQEGCSEKATITYKRKEPHCTYCGQTRGPSGFSIDLRSFCDRHARRGDCGLDDADRNYELYEQASV